MNRTKLAKVLGMMGSAHDGEVLTAAKTAEALVREAGLTWFDLVGGVPACGLDWMETQKGGALVDLPKDIRIVVFEKNMLWKFLVNLHRQSTINVYFRHVRWQFWRRKRNILMSISRDGLVMSITEIDFNGEVPTDELSDYPMGPEAALCLRVWEIAQTIQAETYERFKKELAKIIPEDLLTWYFTLGMSEGKTASRDIFLL